MSTTPGTYQIRPSWWIAGEYDLAVWGDDGQSWGFWTLSLGELRHRIARHRSRGARRVL